MKKILIVNGPNLNLLGTREPEIYGKLTLNEIETKLKSLAQDLKIEIECFQSNHEGEIVDKICGAQNIFNGIIINPAAYTHTSVAIRDAISAVKIPTIEVHISNIYSRDEFRHNSFIAPVSIGQISGLGLDGYLFALEYFSR
ncbi:MAG: type II 3-dehydroquinate dehydratase [Endomicrobiia bacterium]|nr:type II 3-dehydroquinate dehydratase [Endomicrobiaceae bacterium]MDD5101769.1 type II 3-dehydroquinate dehydratase [Endomicrobiaceae bacterium]